VACPQRSDGVMWEIAAVAPATVVDCRNLRRVREGRSMRIMVREVREADN
jgi:hypothetical protein